MATPEMPEVNDPQALAELTAAFRAYERALTANDIEAVNRLFWASPLTLRYGPKELQYSAEEIAQFRLRRGAINQGRTLRNTRIKTFGRDFGVADTEYIPEGTSRVGRQSQTWVRSSEGWRIVSAHVSFLET